MIVEETEGTDRKSPLRVHIEESGLNSSIPLEDSEVEKKVEMKKESSENIKSMSAVKRNTPIFLKKSIIKFRTKETP